MLLDIANSRKQKEQHETQGILPDIATFPGQATRSLETGNDL